MRVLFVDNFFPTAYNKWEQEEVYSFIKKFDEVDFLVKYQGNKYRYPIDYEKMKERYQLDKYNILIFYQKYNKKLNRYNKPTFDGTKFNNNKSQFTHMFTTHNSFDLSRYDLVYHLFLQCYTLFNKSFDFPLNKQAIHLYPGGGYNPSLEFPPIQVSKEVKIIATQPFTVSNLKKYNFTNWIACYGGVYLQEDTPLVQKEIKDSSKKLNLIFSCFGWGGKKVLELKGYFHYIRLIDYIKLETPALFSKINFYCAGYIEKKHQSDNIQYLDRMDQKDLDLFYQQKIDIKINLHKKYLEGWPLGIEAMLQGVVMIITDHYDLNETFQYKRDEEMYIVNDENDMKYVTKLIEQLEADRELLNGVSKAGQKKTREVVSYQNQQEKIFEFLTQ